MPEELPRLEMLAAELEATGDYKILRRIRKREAFNPPDGTPVKTSAVNRMTVANL